jgi:dynein heavy chain
MDAVLESISVSLFNGALPQEWANLAPDTRKNLSSWMEHFEQRIAQYTQWVHINLLRVFLLAYF